MQQMISYCGLECSRCPAMIARQTDDSTLREKTARQWSEMFKMEIAPEAVDCEGCLSEGVHGPYCAACEIRKCALDRQVGHCAFCDDTACEKLAVVHRQEPECRERLDAMRQQRTS